MSTASDQPKKWVFIINPVAGNGFALTLTDTIREMIVKYNLDATVIFTEYKGHASELARQYADEGYTYIIGVGGDGTMNEIASPLVYRNDVILGLIGGGTGNDFIQITGFPGRFGEKEWEIFFSAHAKPMDIGRCNDKIFLNGMGLGFDAQVAAENYDEEGHVKEGWKYKYIWHILKTLFVFREQKMTVVANGSTHETDCFINTVANGRRFAGSFFLTPNAIANDSLLDICSIKRLSLFQRLRILFMVPKGTHINDEHVNYFKADKLSLRFPSKVPFHVDGELYFADYFEVAVLPGALNFIYNPEGAHYFADTHTSEVCD
ncbi:MAG: YegS/Rv2252/BmrU family lipid kinase [Bacteroidales bacterium]|nr:YegS/Rv2252/BmrU family lipid kinase [Bacteroidales bacterium]